MGWSSTLAAVIGRNVSRPTASSTVATGRPGRPAAVEHRGGQVEPGGRGRHRAGPVGVHGLVALGVGQRRGDVGRQRHDAVPARATASSSVGRPADPQPDLAGCRRRAPGRRRRPRGRRRPPARVPGRTRRLGRTSASHRPPASRSSSRTSTAPPVGLRRRRRAGRTRVVLTTSTSPGPQQVGQVGAPCGGRWRPRRPGVDQQAAPRPGLDAGRWAMAPAGRS